MTPGGAFETKRLPPGYDCLAPDGSEIRMLLGTTAGGTSHCTLGPRRVSLAVRR